LESRETEWLKAAEERETRIVELCQALVRINSVNPYSGDPEAKGEAEGQAFLALEVENAGAEAELRQVPEDIYKRTQVVGPKGRSFQGRPNLHAKVVFGEGTGPVVLLNGHMDTVAATDMEIDPFSGERKDGFVWGRGSSDCKSGLTVGWVAVEALLSAAKGLNGTILFDSVVDEECNGSGAGTLAACLLDRKPDWAIFLDGGQDCITTGCSGCLTASLVVHGKTAHAASGDGVNAIDKGFLVKRGLDLFKAQRESERPRARVNLGVFRAGVHPAMVPGSAQMELNIVYELDEAEKARDALGRWGGGLVMRAFEETVQKADAADSWLGDHPTELDWVKDLPPFLTPSENGLAAAAAQAFEDALGRKPHVGPMEPWTDSAFSFIVEGIPTILMGPSLEGAAHAPDEKVKVEDMVETCKALTLLVGRLLSKENDS